MLKTSLHWLAAAMFGGLGVRNPASLLDNAPLRELLTHNVRFDGIRARDRAGPSRRRRGDRFGVRDRALRDVLPRAARARAVDARPPHRPRQPLTIDHLMASAAVPFVFPPVQIGGEFYGDGSMRHRAPLSPAIHLGADRMLVVGVRDERPDAEPPLGATPEPPTFAHLGGYMLDTLFMDGLYTDLERLSRHQSNPRAARATESCRATWPRCGRCTRSSSCRSRICARSPRSTCDELPRGVRLLLRGLGATQQ